MTQAWWPKVRDGEVVGYLTDDEWKKLLAIMEPCTAPQGEVIFKKGSPSRSLLLVEAGEVEVFDTSMGETVVLATLGEGGIVGEVGFVDGLPRTHGVRARVDCRLRRLTREALLEVAKGDSLLFGKLTMALAELLAQRFRVTVRELEPVRAFAATLQEPMELPDPAAFDEIEASAPDDEPESGEALRILKELARNAKKDLARV